MTTAAPHASDNNRYWGMPPQLLQRPLIVVLLLATIATHRCDCCSIRNAANGNTIEGAGQANTENIKETIRETVREAVRETVRETVRQTVRETLLQAMTQSAVTPAQQQQQQQPQHWQLITRAEWSARQPTSVSNFTQTAPYVIIHHSYRPDVCTTTAACKAAMRSMQNYHMNEHKWSDIGYSFAVGGDGNVYEGCGYGVVGAHAPKYNSRSIGLLLIGDFREKQPSPLMLQTAQSFLAQSVAAGKLLQDYTLYGHRQVRSTECPGAALYALIQKWQHWQDIV